MQTLALLTVLLPLLAACIGPLGYLQQLGPRFTMGVTAGLVTLSALFSVLLYLHLAVGGATPFTVELYHWFSVGSLELSFGVLADKLTATMFIVVTIVSACVHWYSMGYMADEGVGRVRFFSYLSLFTFMMLALVSAPNLVQMFLGWEGVGLASYLLIGYYYKKNSANAASMKAFIVNRIADVGLLLAICATFAVVGGLDYYDLFTRVDELKTQGIVFLGHTWGVLDLIALLFFIGAMGKSAQIGFHTWLPDAMEGPTPVSALIHAATMVTAGVFLLARLSPLFEASAILPLVAIVGAVTAIFAAIIGLTQHDIKRVIAYSTCSQLGYMFFACGVGAYHAAMFHLTTHAFFKALLFLGAGSVIHALHHEQDLRNMGGLKKSLIVTYALMWLGSLALAGIPPFAGFFSKDLILESAAYVGGSLGWWLYIFGVIAAWMTAFYSFRLIFLCFHGKSTLSPAKLKQVHESPLVMQIPMFVLAGGAILGGWFFYKMGYGSWWAGSIETYFQGHPHVHPVVKWFPMFVALFGIGVAYWLYIKHRTKQAGAQVSTALTPLSTWSERKWYIDEFYDWLIVQNVRRIAYLSAVQIDRNLIDRFGPDGIALQVRRAGERLRNLQSGYIYHYAFAMIAGIVILLGVFLLRGVL